MIISKNSFNCCINNFEDNYRIQFRIKLNSYRKINNTINDRKENKNDETKLKIYMATFSKRIVHSPLIVSNFIIRAISSLKL